MTRNKQFYDLLDQILHAILNADKIVLLGDLSWPIIQYLAEGSR